MLQIAVACLVLAAEPSAAAPPVVDAAPAAAASAPAPAPAPVEPAAAPPAAPAAPPAAPVAETAAPAASPAAEGAPADPDAPMRVTGSLGLARGWPDGLVSSREAMNDLASSTLGVRIDVGFRITQKWMVALAFDGQGGATPGANYRLLCAMAEAECSVSTTRTTLEARYVYRPTAPRTWWIGAGLGSEATRVGLKGASGTRSFLPTYTGGLFKLSTGWDRRVSQKWGWGFFGAYSMGTYDQVSLGDSKDKADVPGDRRSHSWLDLGVRVILFP